MLWRGLQTFRDIQFALRSSYWSEEELKQRQVNLLKKLLIHAYENVPLYSKLYQSYDFNPRDFQSWEDLNKIPILKKSYLKESTPADQIQRRVKAQDCKEVYTSGSTGQPLKIILGPAEQNWQRMSAWRILFEHGFRWTDRTLEIRMTLGENYFLQLLGIAPKYWCSLLDSPETWVKCLEKNRPQVIVASAQVLEVFAKSVEEVKPKWKSPKLIISDSETLLPNTREYIQKIFGVVPIDVYGLVELSNFAWECEKHSGFHVSADSHIVEVACEQNNIGNMIVTGLGMFTMPIIRYDTEDLAEFSPVSCSCGRNLPLLKNIYGRRMDSVILPSGKVLLWPFFHEIIGSYSAIKRWQIIQDINHQLNIKIECSSPNLKNQLEEKIQALLPEPLPIKIIHQTNLLSTLDKKAIVIQSKALR